MNETRGPMLEALREDLLDQYGMFRVGKVDASLDALVEEIKAEERARIAFGLRWMYAAEDGYPEDRDWDVVTAAQWLDGNSER